jgi:hypothetical protein
VPWPLLVHGCRQAHSGSVEAVDLAVLPGAVRSGGLPPEPNWAQVPVSGLR